MKSIKETVKKTNRSGVSGNAVLFILEDGTVVPVKNRELSAIEDSKYATAIISSIAKEAGMAAASEAKALKISLVYATATQVISENADGKKTVLATSEALPGKKYFKMYTPGTIMHAVKKKK